MMIVRLKLNIGLVSGVVALELNSWTDFNPGG